ncbi:hypothetical protein QKT49_gp034 [Acanthamoeba castellanii medusavirus]|uniref:Uncharacterized protein n=1 Tax=Acanthamoeba castellanii medusavirus J1 TaxID=3114988 RepID=A0A3T1CWH4_9VIRU|nr:hypothetical protein QKT49_gp034 [Acanthamoeba castellanii medusavirus]BBI30174.1 hypothetical protein [Acanthamoeba castellanii medusavirus J1]
MNLTPIAADEEEMKAQRSYFVSIGMEPAKADAMINAMRQAVADSNEHVAMMQQEMSKIKDEIERRRARNQG